MTFGVCGILLHASMIKRLSADLYILDDLVIHLASACFIFQRLLLLRAGNTDTKEKCSPRKPCLLACCVGHKMQITVYDRTSGNAYLNTNTSPEGLVCTCVPCQSYYRSPLVQKCWPEQPSSCSSVFRAQRNLEQQVLKNTFCS